VRQRVAVLCPGRGSYRAKERDSLHGLAGHPRASELAELVERIDASRHAAGDLAIREMDTAARFKSQFLLGHNAAPLIFAVTAYEFLRLDPDKVEVVAVGGNSMGWYSALACAGALDLEESFHLVQTMGSMTREGNIGGQLIYPAVDTEWRPSSDRQQTVARALEQAGKAGECGRSIRFGGFEVLWGDSEALSALAQALPPLLLGKQEYPLQLFGNSAFHSPLMVEVSLRAHELLVGLKWRAPTCPLVDGRGAQWRPLTTDLAALSHYTLGDQVIETFDFGATVRTLLREYAPDRIVLLGPGESLGSAVAQVLIREGWHDIHDRESFLETQRRDPFLISLRREEQARLVT